MEKLIETSLGFKEYSLQMKKQKILAQYVSFIHDGDYTHITHILQSFQYTP
jgi:hypothetical protein